jgi:nicotinamide-nucleotide amidase
MPEAQDLQDAAHLLADDARDLLERLRRRRAMLTTAESCTGGLLASLFTDIQGCSNVFDRGFVTYSEGSKSDLLGVEPIEIRRHGVVSAEIALSMAEGALARSEAEFACAVTGFAGPAGDGDEAGLVYLAVVSRNGRLIQRESHFGSRPRDEVRHLVARAAIEMLNEALDLDK